MLRNHFCFPPLRVVLPALALPVLALLSLISPALVLSCPSDFTGMLVHGVERCALVYSNAAVDVEELSGPRVKEEGCEEKCRYGFVLLLAC